MSWSNYQRHPCSCWVDPWELQTRPAVSDPLLTYVKTQCLCVCQNVIVIVLMLRSSWYLKEAIFRVLDSFPRTLIDCWCAQPQSRECQEDSSCLGNFFPASRNSSYWHPALHPVELYLCRQKVRHQLLPHEPYIYCQAQVQSPKVKTKGTWADTKITWATTTPPLTFKHKGVLW